MYIHTREYMLLYDGGSLCLRQWHQTTNDIISSYENHCSAYQGHHFHCFPYLEKMSNPEEVANAFVNHFYQTFAGNAEGLATLYSQSSMLTFEGQQFQGSEAIIGKLKTVGKVSHQVKSMDVQPSVGGNALVIFVTGHVSIGEGGNPLHFCEMFQLVSTGPNAYYVHNDVFRLNYGL